MIKVYEENGTYDIDVYANEKEEERNNSIMGLTIDTKRHMYYVVLPEKSEKNEYKEIMSTFFKMNMLSRRQIHKILKILKNPEYEKFILKSLKMNMLRKMYLSEIAKDPRNVSLSGETKVYEKEILKNIFRSQGIIPVTYAERDQIASDLEDIKAYNLGIKSENDIFRMR